MEQNFRKRGKAFISEMSKAKNQCVSYDFFIATGDKAIRVHADHQRNGTYFPHTDNEAIIKKVPVWLLKSMGR